MINDPLLVKYIQVTSSYIRRAGYRPISVSVLKCVHPPGPTRATRVPLYLCRPHHPTTDWKEDKESVCSLAFRRSDSTAIFAVARVMESSLTDVGVQITDPCDPLMPEVVPPDFPLTDEDEDDDDDDPLADDNKGEGKLSAADSADVAAGGDESCSERCENSVRVKIKLSK